MTTASKLPPIALARGATVGDVLSKPPRAGGLGVGTLGASLILLALLLGAVALETVRRRRSVRA